MPTGKNKKSFEKLLTKFLKGVKYFSREREKKKSLSQKRRKKL